ncbi:hypothetical protein P3T16_006292 [Paraburkholderia sp. GAS42]
MMSQRIPMATPTGMTGTLNANVHKARWSLLSSSAVVTDLAAQ